MDEKTEKSGLTGVLNAILGLSAKLPAPLAYGLGVSVTIVVLAVLQAQGVSNNLILLLAVVILSALVAFVYLDAKQRQQAKPIYEVVSDIEKAFSRKTFTEPLRECARQNWVDRYRGTCETYDALSLYRNNIEVTGSDELKSAFKKLLREVDGYRDDLAAHLLKELEFPRAENGHLVIPQEIEKPCEEHRKAIEALLRKLPRR